MPDLVNACPGAGERKAFGATHSYTHDKKMGMDKQTMT
jgi:hypothetical protein